MRDTTLRHGGRLWSIVLAAGASTRLQRPKQLVRLNSVTLLERAVRIASAASPGRVIVALGADALRMRAHLQRSKSVPRIVLNKNWPLGMGTTLSRAARTVPNDASAVLVLLTDQPRIKPRSIRSLVRASQRHPGHAVASTYAGRLGVPAIFPRKLFRALRSLDGDSGARHLLRGYGRTVHVAVPEARIDIDSPADVALLERKGAGI